MQVDPDKHNIVAQWFCIVYVTILYCKESELQGTICDGICLTYGTYVQHQNGKQEPSRPQYTLQGFVLFIDVPSAKKNTEMYKSFHNNLR